MKVFVTRALLVGAIVVLHGRPAVADTLSPAAFVVLGTLLELHLVPAIVLVEAVIAKRILATSAARSLSVAVVANVASGLIGLPLASLLFWRGLRGIGHPAGDSALVALMLLGVPCFVVSVWVERHVARWLVPADRRPRCGRWSLEANIASYMLIEGVLIALFTAITVWRSQGLIR
jgi:hypothetical protein